MKYSESGESDDETSMTGDFFDPFWMLFGDDLASVDDESRMDPIPTKGLRLNDKNDRVKRKETKVVRRPSEERGPSEHDSKEKNDPGRNKKQHYWRKSKTGKGQRLGFGRRGDSSKKLPPARSASIEPEVFYDDAPDQSVVSSLPPTIRPDDATLTDTITDAGEDGFPSLMNVIGRPWGAWLEASSSSDSSEGSQFTEETGSTLGAAVREPPVREPPVVQQVLVQFNPAQGLQEERPETVSSYKSHTRAHSLPPLQMATGRSRELLSESPRPATLKNMRPASLKNMRPAPLKNMRPASLKNMPRSASDVTSETGITADEADGRTMDPVDHISMMSLTDEDHKERSKCLDLRKLKNLGTGKKTSKMLAAVPLRNSMSQRNKDPESVFPKLRMVADEKVGGSQPSAVVPNDKNFKASVPAHLQLSMDAFLKTRGPQSLYEYEYEGAEHVDIAYNHFGPNPLSLLVIRHHVTPPRPRDKLAIVQVEASTISMADCSMRRGEWEGKDTPPLPITPGIDMVGKIFHIDKEMSSLHNLLVGDRVMALTRCGGNSRFLSIVPEQLVKISDNVDPAEAVCLADTYLSAFQILHFGQGGGLRYRSNSMKGKSVLIVGTLATVLGHAFVELAFASGVERIFATSAAKHFPQLRSLGIIPVSDDPSLWLDQLDKQMDLVFVSNSDEDIVPDHFKVLNDKGHLIVVGQRAGDLFGERDDQFRAQTSLVCKRRPSKLNMIERTHEYNPFRQYEQDLEKCKKDLSHLVKLLGRGDIKPNVLDRIPLGKVAKAQDMVESQRHPSGFLVCEPWLRNKKRAVRL